MTSQRPENTGTHIEIGEPSINDGAAMWRITRDSGTLDLNSPYTYLLWCRDFASCSVVARSGTGVVGFITGYRRPDSRDTFVVWQVAVDPSHRGQRLASRMLAHLTERMLPAGARFLEATVTPDNAPSAQLFTAFARVHEANLERHELFATQLFPEPHEPEILFRIGPIA